MNNARKYHEVILLPFITLVFLPFFFIGIGLSQCIPKYRKSGKYIVRCFLQNHHNLVRFYAFFTLVISKWFKRQFLSFFFRRKWAPEMCAIQLTDRCNNNCAFCFSDTGCRNSDIPKEKLYEFVSYMKRKGTLIFLLIGGEPFLHTNIHDVISKNKDVYFLIITNGKIDERDIDAIEKEKNVFLLISTQIDSAVTDAIRGPGTADRLLRLYAELRKKKILFGISVVATKQNYTTLCRSETYTYYQSLGVSLIWVSPYLPVGTGRHEEHILSVDDLNALSDTISDYVVSKTGLLTLDIIKDTQLLGCSAGRRLIYVDVNLKIYPCFYLCDNCIGDADSKTILRSISSYAGTHSTSKTCMGKETYLTDYFPSHLTGDEY